MDWWYCVRDGAEPPLCFAFEDVRARAGLIAPRRPKTRSAGCLAGARLVFSCPRWIQGSTAVSKVGGFSEQTFDRLNPRFPERLADIGSAVPSPAVQSLKTGPPYLNLPVAPSHCLATHPLFLCPKPLGPHTRLRACHLYSHFSASRAVETKLPRGEKPIYATYVDGPFRRVEWEPNSTASPAVHDDA